MDKEILKAEEGISNILAELQINLSKNGFQIKSLSFIKFGKQLESTPPGYGYFVPTVKILIGTNG